MKEYSEEEKEKYVRGFKKCTLPLYEYARKMKINPEDLKQWLKKDNGSALFGKIEMKDIIEEPSSTLAKRTAIKFESKNIKIELKENYDKELLMNLMEVLINVK